MAVLARFGEWGRDGPEEEAGGVVGAVALAFDECLEGCNEAPVVNVSQRWGRRRGNAPCEDLTADPDGGTDAVEDQVGGDLFLVNPRLPPSLRFVTNLKDNNPHKHKLIAHIKLELINPHILQKPIRHGVSTKDVSDEVGRWKRKMDVQVSAVELQDEEAEDEEGHYDAVDPSGVSWSDGY